MTGTEDILKRKWGITQCKDFTNHKLPVLSNKHSHVPLFTSAHQVSFFSVVFHPVSPCKSKISPP